MNNHIKRLIEDEIIRQEYCLKLMVQYNDIEGIKFRTNLINNLKLQLKENKK